MRTVIEKGTPTGYIKAPPSKSITHRLLICAALANGQSVIHGISDCDDARATVDCVNAMGGCVRIEDNTATVSGADFRHTAPSGPLCCRESGSTLRFLLPPALLCEKNVMFTGQPSLFSRPMSIYTDLAKEKGFMYSQDTGSVAVRGPLPAGNYRVSGNISSQFISGLLFALPNNDKDSTITLIPPIESRSYINLTVDALTRAGITAVWRDDHTILVPGSQHYQCFTDTVEGDYSNAAFLAALNLFGGSVEIGGLNPESIQGDRIYTKFFEMLCMGVPTIHIGDCPDLGPILFAVAAAKSGGVFRGTARLKLKESDRCLSMARELEKFGVSVSIYDDAVVVYPDGFHAPTLPLDGHNDHRIVMALSVLLTLTGGEIRGSEAVSKSYPEFFEDLQKLGIKVTCYDQ